MTSVWTGADKAELDVLVSATASSRSPASASREAFRQAPSVPVPLAAVGS